MPSSNTSDHDRSSSSSPDLYSVANGVTTTTTPLSATSTIHSPTPVDPNNLKTLFLAHLSKKLTSIDAYGFGFLHSLDAEPDGRNFYWRCNKWSPVPNVDDHLVCYGPIPVEEVDKLIDTCPIPLTSTLVDQLDTGEVRLWLELEADHLDDTGFSETGKIIHIDTTRFSGRLHWMFEKKSRLNSSIPSRPSGNHQHEHFRVIMLSHLARAPQKLVSCGILHGFDWYQTPQQRFYIRGIQDLLYAFPRKDKAFLEKLSRGEVKVQIVLKDDYPPTTRNPATGLEDGQGPKLSRCYPRGPRKGKHLELEVEWVQISSPHVYIEQGNTDRVIAANPESWARENSYQHHHHQSHQHRHQGHYGHAAVGPTSVNGGRSDSGTGFDQSSSVDKGEWQVRTGGNRYNSWGRSKGGNKEKGWRGFSREGGSDGSTSEMGSGSGRR